MTYDHRGTKRQNMYNDKGHLLLRGMTGCEVDQTLLQLHHACCYQEKVLDRYKNSTPTLTNTEKI